LLWRLSATAFEAHLKHAAKIREDLWTVIDSCAALKQTRKNKQRNQNIKTNCRSWSGCEHIITKVLGKKTLYINPN